MYRLSVLDISPVSSGSSSADALRNTVDLAKLADELGYTRYWLAEHHNSPLIASSVPEVMIAHVANATRGIRVGSGGIMLPNHAPLKVAETFRVLEALHPGRIDLGIGRAAGTDPMTALALRRSKEALIPDDFPAQLDELMGFLNDNLPENHPFQGITAMPAGVPPPEIWILGSSYFGAELAATLGLRFAFAHHIQPFPAVGALQLYREQFRPLLALSRPQSLLAVSVICADTDEGASEIARPAELRLLQRRSGRFLPLSTIEEAKAYPYTDEEREVIRNTRARLFVGSPSTIREALVNFAEQTGVEEIMITTLVHDHKDRRHSYELLAEAFALSPRRHLVPETARSHS